MKLAHFLIRTAREKQIEKGYTPEHDDNHVADYYEDLICAGGTYELEPIHRGRLETWPWCESTFRPSYQEGYRGRIKELAKAGALYTAAREMIERQGRKSPFTKSLTRRIDGVAAKIAELLKTLKQFENV